MAVTATVNISDFEFGNRFDAELYRPSLRESFDLLHQTTFELTRLRRTCLIRSGTTPPDRVDGLKEGPILFKTTDIRNGVIPSRGDYYRISKTIHDRMVKTTISERDVLLNIVGATLDVIGRSGFVAQLECEANITQAMVFLRSRTPNLLPGYLFAFLNTYFGQEQIARYARPTGQYNLNLQEVGHILIPLLPLPEQEAIENMVLSASGLLEKSENCYSQAQQLIESELGLDKLRFDKPVGYTASFSELESSLRFDPEHYYPTFKSLCSGLPKAVSLEPLYKFAEPLKTGIQPTYLENGRYEVINSKHIGVNKIDTSNLRRAASAPFSVLANDGDVLLNATGRGSLGRCAVLDSDTPRIFDVCIIRIRPTDIDPYFLSALLNTSFGQLQMELHTRGTSGQLHLYPRDARKILIWPAPEPFQAEVRKLLIKASRYSQEGTQLLEQAKSRVEQLIEKAVQP